MFGGGPCCFPRCLVGVRVGHLFRFLCSVLFIFVLCLECPMLSGSLYCPFLLSGSLYCPFLIAQCCQGLCTVHSWLPNVVRVSVLFILDCPMLSGSLYCPFLLSGSLYCPFLIAQCCQGLCTVHSWLPNVVRVSVLSILECPMLSGSLYCPFLIAHYVSLTSIYKCTGASNVSIPTYDSRHICGKSLTNIS